MEVARILGVQLHHTTAFHPRANGLLSLLSQNCTEGQSDRWIEWLPWVLLGLRTDPKEDLQTSSAELVYGQSWCPGRFHSRQHKVLESISWTLCPPVQNQYFQTHSYLSAWTDGNLDARKTSLWLSLFSSIMTFTDILCGPRTMARFEFWRLESKLSWSTSGAVQNESLLIDLKQLMENWVSRWVARRLLGGVVQPPTRGQTPERNLRLLKRFNLL